jgi:branched-chain amino acid transport system permease protein
LKPPGFDAQRVVTGVVVVGLVLLPFTSVLVGNDYAVTMMTRVVVLAIAAASLNLILGYGGMISLGHAAFVGVGGYTFAVMAESGITSGFIQWPTAILASALAALAIGALSLRTSGVYFIMVTLAFAQMFYFVSVGVDAFGGDDGLTVHARSDFGSTLSLADRRTYYFTCLALLFASLAIFARIARSPFGLVIRGAAVNERRMKALGMRVYYYRLAAFCIAGGVAGLAGVLLTNHNDFISPGIMHWTRSADLIIIVVLGGMGTAMGPLYGALAFMVAEELLSGVTTYWQLIFGPLILIFVRFAGKGIAGLLEHGGAP